MADRAPDLRSLCRAHTEAIITKLAGFIHTPQGVPHSVQVQAAAILLERGWGKAAQPQTGEDGEGPILVEIIQRVREKK